MPPLPPTPPPQDRPFESIALSSTELPRASWWWLPLTLGLFAIRNALVPVSVFLILGGWWRFLCLKRLRAAGVEDGLLRLWRRLLAIWCVTGLFVVAGIAKVGIDGLSEQWMQRAMAAWDLWRLVAVAEMLVATVWIARGAVRRDSAWAAVLVGAGFAASLISISLLDLTQRSAGGPLTLLLGAIRTVCGLAGPLLIADAASRLLQSMSAERLDEENEGFLDSGPRV